MSDASTIELPADILFLRHTLATLAYRAEKVLRAAPPAFPEHDAGHGVRTPLSIVGHLGDLLEWAERMASGPATWTPASVGNWDADVERFFGALARLDARVASGEPLAFPAATLFQAPIADALTHIGQLALLRRHSGVPVRPESYARATIGAGRVGRDQAAPGKEFDGDASVRR
jgi:hypothetical protein